MAGQLLPPPDFSPTVGPEITPQQRIAIWLDMLRSGSKLLFAGLRQQVGPDGDVIAAYRKWYAQQMDEHDQTVIRMLQRMTRSEDSDGG